MKFTVKILCLLLAAMLCVSMAGCTIWDAREETIFEEEEAFEAANALLEAGEYEEAIAAFKAIGRYQEISGKIAEAQELMDEENAGFLFGAWIDLNSGNVIEFKAGGNATITNKDVVALTYEYADDVVTITSPEIFTLDVTLEEDILHLIGSDFDLVREADYAAMAPIAVEITMDNWQEYFELREVNDIWENEFGEVSYEAPHLAIFLKEEYYSRLPEYDVCQDLVFELIYDECLYQLLNCNPDDYDYHFTGRYEKKQIDPPYWSSELGTDLTSIIIIYDNRNNPWMSELSPLRGKIHGAMSTVDFSIDMYGTQYYYGYTNFRVNRVHGTLMLLPE